MVSTVSNPISNPDQRRATSFLDRRLRDNGGTIRDLLTLFIFFVAISSVSLAAVFINWSPGEIDVVSGDIAQETYEADGDVSYVSEIRTEEARREAGSDVNNIVKAYDPQVREDALSDLRSFIGSTTELRDSDTAADQQIEIIQASLPELTEDESELLLEVSPSSWESIASQATQLVDQTMESELQSDGVDAARSQLDRDVSSLLTTTQQDLAVAIASAFIRPNVFIDDEATQATRQAAIDSVEPVVVSVKSGQAIVRDGDAVTERDIEALEALGLLRTNLDPTERLGVAAAMVLLTFVLTSYLYLFGEMVWRQRQLILVALVIIGPIIARAYFASSPGRSVYASDCRRRDAYCNPDQRPIRNRDSGLYRSLHWSYRRPVV